MLVGEVSPGARAAGPDLIANQKQVVLIAQPAQDRQVIIVGDIDAAFALDRLDDDRNGLAVDGVLGGVQMVERDVGEPGEVWLEPEPGFVLPGRRHGAERAAVEAVVHGDDLEAVALGAWVGLPVEAGELERGFVGVGAAVAEEGSALEAVGGDRLSQLGLGVGV